MRGPLVAVLLLVLLLQAPTPAPGAPSSVSSKQAEVSEGRRLALSNLGRALGLAGWDWYQEEGAAGGGGGGRGGGGGGEGAATTADEDAESQSWEFVPAGSKRALSVLSRFTPFTSLGTRRMGRYPVRPRAPSMPRDYISAETRGDFSDRPSGQPLRWGR